MLWLVLPVALTALLAASPATAKKKHHKKKVKHPGIGQVWGTARTTQHDEVTTIRLTCPPGRTAVSGGFRSDFSPIDGSKPVIVRSKAIPPRSWEIAAVEGNNPGGQFAGVAFCERLGKTVKTKKGKKRFKQGTFQEALGVGYINPGEIATINATCPTGLRAISGGWDLPTPLGEQMLPLSSARFSRDTWSFQGWILLGSTRQVARSYAYCAKESRKELWNVMAVAADLTSPGALNAPSCSGGEHLAGVGFRQSANLGGGRTSVLVNDAFPANPFTARIMGTQLGNYGTALTAISYCV